MDKFKFINDIINSISLRLSCGGALFNSKNEQHINTVVDVCKEYNIDKEKTKFIVEFLNNENTKKMSSSDIDLLKNLGLELSSNSEYEKINLKQDHSKVMFDTGSGAKHFSQKKVDYKTLLSAVLSDKKQSYITYSRTINKMRTSKNSRMIQWKRIKNLNHPDIDQIIAIYNLYKSYPDKFIISQKVPAGVTYEVLKVNEINEFLKDFSVPLKLYMKRDGKLIDMGVTVKSAIKVVGTGKADISLLDENQKEVFWISYKEGDFFKKENEIANVPFQQYGSLQTLYDKKTPDEINLEDAKQSDIKKLINKFMKTVLDESGARKYSINGVTNIEPTNDEKFILSFESATKKMSVTNTNILYPILDDVQVNSKLEKFIKDKKVINIHFYLQGNKEYFYNFISKEKKIDKKTLKNIAGKSIYGMDFFVGNKKFGRENVNILLQTSKPLDIKLHKINAKTELEEPDGIIIDTDSRGHVMYNPNLPSDIEKEIEKSVEEYQPVLNVRYTRKEVFRWESENGEQNIILGARLLILPVGKTSVNAIEIEK